MALATAFGACIFVAAVWFVPAPIVLPLLSVAAVAGAILIASLGWWSAQRFASHDLSYWDVAGVMTLVGIFAALLSDPEQVIPLLEIRQNK